jgi:hypothetical protein
MSFKIVADNPCDISVEPNEFGLEEGLLGVFGS